VAYSLCYCLCKYIVTKSILKVQIQLGEDGKAKWKQGWHSIGDKLCYFRSNWERRYALFLHWLKTNGKIAEWMYEPETFWFENIKRGTRSYKPDFKVIHKNGDVEYVEVKGYMDKQSATKLKRMKIYHPHIKVRLVDKVWFSENGKALKSIFIDW